MICPLLTYADMQKAMAELAEIFELRIVWLGDGVAEIRWNGGVAVAQTDQPEALHGSHVGHGWTYVRVPIPMRTTRQHSTAEVRSSTNHTLHPMAHSAATAPAIERATSGPSDPTSSAANAGVNHTGTAASRTGRSARRHMLQTPTAIAQIFGREGGGSGSDTPSYFRVFAVVRA